MCVHALRPRAQRTKSSPSLRGSQSISLGSLKLEKEKERIETAAVPAKIRPFRNMKVNIRGHDQKFGGGLPLGTAEGCGSGSHCPIAAGPQGRRGVRAQTGSGHSP